MIKDDRHASNQFLSWNTDQPGLLRCKVFVDTAYQVGKFIQKMISLLIINSVRSPQYRKKKLKAICEGCCKYRETMSMYSTRIRLVYHVPHSSYRSRYCNCCKSNQPLFRLPCLTTDKHQRGSFVYYWHKAKWQGVLM